MGTMCTPKNFTVEACHRDAPYRRWWWLFGWALVSVVYVIKLMTTPGMSVTWMTEVFGALTSPPWKRISKPGMNGARLWSPSRKTTRNGRQRKSKYLACAPSTKKMTDWRLPKIRQRCYSRQILAGPRTYTLSNLRLLTAGAVGIHPKKMLMLCSTSWVSLGANRAASEHLRRVWYGARSDLALATVIHRWCRIKRLRDMLEWKRKPEYHSSAAQDKPSRSWFYWRHWNTRFNQVPKVDQVLDLRRTNSQDTDRHKHVLREAYRRHHFRQWTREDRHDSWELRAHHSEEHLLHCYIQSSAKDIRYPLKIPQLLSLILGSFVSPAALAAAHQKDVSVDGLCPFCAASISTLDHILWECDRNRPGTVLVLKNDQK